MNNNKVKTLFMYFLLSLSRACEICRDEDNKNNNEFLNAEISVPRYIMLLHILKYTVMNDMET